MNPNANLAAQLDLAYQLISGRPTSPADPRTVDDVLDDAAALAELVIDLNHWMLLGRALPGPWARGRVAARSQP